jgi:hypothetical protein
VSHPRFKPITSRTVISRPACSVRRSYCHDFEVRDYTGGMDWVVDSLTTCIHHSELHFTVHWHTKTSVLSLLQPPVAVSWQQIFNTVEILQHPALRSSCHSRSCRTLVNWQPLTNWFPGWRLFYTNLLFFSSQADFQLTTDNWTHSLSTSFRWTADNSLTSTNSLLQTFLLISSRHGPYRKHRSISALVSVATATCLTNRCLVA